MDTLCPTLVSPYHEEEEGMDGGGRWLGKLAIGEHR